jgi:hypothetical protein
MADTRVGWEGELGRWLEPFLERLGRKARQRMCPLYVAGLTRAYDNDRLRLPSASSPHPSEAGKKESTDRQAVMSPRRRCGS